MESEIQADRSGRTGGEGVWWIGEGVGGVKGEEPLGVAGGDLGQFGRGEIAEGGDSLGGVNEPGRFVGETAAEGVGAEVGAVGLDEEAVVRDAPRDLAERVVFAAGEGDHPGKRDVESQGEELLGIGGGAGEGVEDAADGPAQAGELGDDLGFAVAAVDDQGEIELLGQFNVAVEKDALLVEGGVVPVAVETGFAEGADAGLERQAGDGVPVVGRRLGDEVGLDADGGEQTPVAGGEVKGVGRVGGGGGNGEDLADARGRGIPEDRIELEPKRCVGQVGVGVDQAGLKHGSWSGT